VSTTGCFWDKTTSGMTRAESSAAGKTTYQMHDANTFLNAGWDFTTPIWIMPNGDYPKLAWEAEPPPGDFVSPEGLAFLAQHWLDTNCAANNDCDGADIYKDENDIVNFLDFALFAENLMEK
jgi:hypothetical protein